MTTYLNAAADALNIPASYAFLLFGLVLGFALGWVLGRQRPAAPDDSQSAAQILPAPDPQHSHAATSAGVSLVVNGKTVEVDPAVMEEIQVLTHSGQKIDAIKRLREVTGLNLAAAKAVVESLEKVAH